MALAVGSRVPPFALPGSDGRTWSDEELRGRAYVLTFYPKDETPGCTAQACAFRDAWDAFQGSGVLVFGVSRDPVESHRSFARNQRLPYVLLADEKAHLHKALDVGRNLLGGANRVSYLVDGEGVIRAVYESNILFGAHAQRMIEAVRAL